MKVELKKLLGLFACFAILLVPATAAKASFLPTDLSGNVLWLDAADTSTISQNAGTFTWADKSITGNGDVASSDDNRPVTGSVTQNGLNLLTFDGTDDYLSGSAVLAAGDDTYTYFVVWFPHDNKTQTIYDQADAEFTYSRRAALLATGKNTYGFNGYYNDAHELVPYTADTWRLTAMEIDNATSPNIHISDNGSDLYSGTTTSWRGFEPSDLDVGAGGIRVGAKMKYGIECFDGEIAEIIVFDRLLSDGSVDPIDNEYNDMLYYLDQKWGLGNGISPTAVPEPSALVLIVIGLVMIVSCRLRRR